jgi:threonine dehydratase
MTAPALPSVDQLLAARDRIRGLAVRTPLIRLHGVPGEIWLKLENLQPIGSFKLRGAGNAMRSLPASALVDGVVTASAGNMAQGVAWCARELGIPCRVIVPDNAPAAKTEAVDRLCAKLVRRTYEDWWRVLAAEVSTAAPLRASLDAGKPVGIEHVKSFVDGIGGRSVLPAMWPLVRQVVDDALVVSLDQVADAIRVLVRQARVVAEGAGAAAVASALARGEAGRTVCVVSGGNIDSALLERILIGRSP